MAMGILALLMLGIVMFALWKAFAPQVEEPELAPPDESSAAPSAEPAPTTGRSSMSPVAWSSTAPPPLTEQEVDRVVTLGAPLSSRFRIDNQRSPYFNAILGPGQPDFGPAPPASSIEPQDNVVRLDELPQSPFELSLGGVAAAADSDEEDPPPGSAD